MPDPAPVVDQVEFWNGEVGQKWVANQERLDRAFAPLLQGLLEGAAPRAGERAIDLGCGCGALSLALASMLGAAGQVLAMDISRPMLEHARAREQAERGVGWAPIDWQQADAGRFAFPPGGFDLIASRFGAMFFSDPVVAFGNMRRALRPGGRLAILCWRPMPENPWVALPRAAILPFVPPPAPVPPDAPGPFAFADAARVGAILAGAGFENVRGATVSGKLQVNPTLDDAVAFLTQLGPASSLLRDVDEATRIRAIAAVRDVLRADPGPSLEARCWLFTATSPG